ncbi:hypothetical protein BCL69_100610 [Nitrosomonas communis]|uniref:Uncharacterized protein n=2 Tax=Nitrosomonadaceae TaxID=206379 RepID=A0A0F7KFC7_9PROT|nr:hypothetical protein [Nitrosomonas communis]AKH37492.1 hypothetical protein AAW31_06170 [Nitrosomonas communis]TYP92325.1 hypothetical protein BCL69_100610 [Nitrosomonas communis]
MHKRLAIHFIILIFFVSMLTNTLGLSFNDKVFAHELDHHYHSALFLDDPQKHLDLHHALGDGGELDAITHLFLHAAGQYQPFFVNESFLIIAPVTEAEALTVFVPKYIPESIPDSLFRPPKNFGPLSS